MLILQTARPPTISYRSSYAAPIRVHVTADIRPIQALSFKPPERISGDRSFIRPVWKGVCCQKHSLHLDSSVPPPKEVVLGRPVLLITRT